MVYSKQILIAVILLIGIGAAVWLYNKDDGSIPKNNSMAVSYEGYVIRNSESLYFAPNSPITGNRDEDKIWIQNSNGENTTVWEKSLKWIATDESKKVEYAKVLIQGELYGPGIYGGVPGYKHEIRIQDIKQIP
jgi:hypothetical protein